MVVLQLIQWALDRQEVEDSSLQPQQLNIEWKANRTKSFMIKADAHQIRLKI